MVTGDTLEKKKELSGAKELSKDGINAHQKTFTLKILHIIKEAQQQHGLRHGDYQRYRSYCSRKLRRIRKSLHFVQVSKHRFQAKKVTQENLADVRYLHIPLMMAERAWSYAMQLKQEANTEPRKRFHLLSRIRKASKIASNLELLCESTKCDARTKLESQAYAAWIKGSLYFELQEWQSAMECFRISQTIYEKLSEALNEDERSLYMQRVEELIPNIRYCAYNIGDESAINDLMQMRLAGNSSGEDLLAAADLDHLIAQTREKQAVTLSEVEWLHHKIPVRNEKIRLFLLNVQDSQVQVTSAPDIQAKIAVYERLLLDCKDALQVVRDEMKVDQAMKSRPEGTQSSQAFLYSYLTYIRLSKTVERNLLLIESLKQNMESEDAKDAKKPTKPQDLVRPFEIIIQNLSEMTQLNGVEADSPFLEETEADILAYKTHRCYYIAEVYAAANKWGEAMALYSRAEEYAKKAALKNKTLAGQLKELALKIEGNKYNVYSLSILGSNDVAAAGKKQKYLVDRLEQFYEDPKLTSSQPQIAEFPPDFEPIPCKPLFFDLALNQVDLPSLDDKVEQKKGGGITGFVRGWLGGWK